jgi:D-galactarolactone cycloisomerase
MSCIAAPTVPIQIAAVEAFCFRAPLEQPLRVAFGVFRDRPSVLVHVVDKDGAEGWGEAWSNFPTVGAEHRARLVSDVIGPRLVGRSLAAPEETFGTLSRELEVLVLQTGEIGPIAQAIAGIDIAVWDLAARRAGMPLYRFLGGAPKDRVPVYATGLSPDDPQELFARWHAAGHRAFKLKTGFGEERDVKNLSALRATVGDAAVITIDSNQIHSADQAIALSRAAAKYDVTWFEEPIRVDAPESEWRKVADASPIPLAGGENLRGEDFDRAIESGILAYVQPDVTKWGGFSGLRPFARRIVGAGRSYCPHYFGGGPALLASLHLLAATGGPGLLEFDARDNAVRQAVIGSLLPVENGTVPVPQSPGLGVAIDLKSLASYRTWPQ